MIPMQIRHFRLNGANPENVSFLGGVLNRQGADFDTWVEWNEEEDKLILLWKRVFPRLYHITLKVF